MDKVLQEILDKLNALDGLVKGQKALEKGQQGINEQLKVIKQRQDGQHQVLGALEEHTRVTRAMVTRIDETLPHIQGDVTRLKEVSASTQDKIEDLNLNVEYTLLQFTKQAAEIRGIKKRKPTAK